MLIRLGISGACNRVATVPNGTESARWYTCPFFVGKNVYRFVFFNRLGTVVALVMLYRKGARVVIIIIISMRILLFK